MQRAPPITATQSRVPPSEVCSAAAAFSELLRALSGVKASVVVAAAAVACGSEGSGVVAAGGAGISMIHGAGVVASPAGMIITHGVGVGTDEGHGFAPAEVLGASVAIGSRSHGAGVTAAAWAVSIDGQGVAATPAAFAATGGMGWAGLITTNVFPKAGAIVAWAAATPELGQGVAAAATGAMVAIGNP